MEIRGIGSMDYMRQIMQEMTGLVDSALESTSEAADDLSSSTSVDISGPAAFLSKLEQLQSSGPEKFQEIVEQLAEKLESAAAEAGDSREGLMLSHMAEQMASVAESGDLSQLRPQPPPSGGAQGGPAAAYEQNMGNSMTTLLDYLNSDDDDESSSLFDVSGQDIATLIDKWLASLTGEDSDDA